MLPTYEGITDFENELQSVADRWEGYNDGWGFFFRTDCKLIIAMNSGFQPFTEKPTYFCEAEAIKSCCTHEKKIGF